MADSSKTEKATEKKREDERKKGNIFQSRDLVSALSILVLFFILKLTMSFVYEKLSASITKYIGYITAKSVLSVSSANDIVKDILVTLFLTAGPVLLGSFFISIIATGIQTKFNFSREHLKFKFSRLNPVQGLKNLISLRSVTELIKAMIKITAIGLILYSAFQKIYSQFMLLIYKDLLQAAVFILNTIMDIVMQLSLVFIGIAVADYLYQWWEHERAMRMSKQEIKEELKEMEGDPLIKNKIRERQRRLANQRMMQKVPTADVIIRNPTHYAVALKYDIEVNSAPIVVAKGQDYVALKIIEIAEQHNIPMKENKPLAQALYKTVPLGQQIPSEYYAVLAEILAWVYSMKKEKS